MNQTEAITPAGNLTVAAAQYPFDLLPSPEAWVEKLTTWVRDGAATGAEILVFPEYAAMEYSGCFGAAVAGDLQKSLSQVAKDTDWRIAQHQALAAKFNVTLIAGSGPVATDAGAFFNEAQVVTPDGAVGRQAKVMMTPFERSWGISAGQHLHVFQLNQARIAVAICYDVEFPLLVQAASAQGADLVCVPSCTEHASGYHRVRTGAQSRALENTIATVQSASIQDAPWCPAIDRNTGAAGVFVPAENGFSETGVLAEGKINQPGWITETIDLRALRRLRETGEMRNAADWQRQPGAKTLATAATVVDLTSNG